MNKYYLILCASIYLLIYSTDNQATEAQKEARSIPQLLQQFSQAWQNNDYSLVDDLYTEHVIYLSGSNEIGIQNRESLFSTVFSQMKHHPEIKRSLAFKVTELVKPTQANTFAFGSGYFYFTEQKPEHQEGELDQYYGKFVMVFALGEDNKWRIRLDADNGCPKAYWDNAKTLF